jgi:hypothetical protein
MRRLLGVALFVAIGAGPVQAAQYVNATFTGVVVSGSDVQGVFGAPGADLTGAHFTAYYSFDPTTLLHVSNSQLDDYHSISLTTPEPAGQLAAAKFVINGAAFTIDVRPYFETQRNSSVLPATFYIDSARDQTGGFGTEWYNFGIPTDVTAPFSQTSSSFCATGSCGGSFSTLVGGHIADNLKLLDQSVTVARSDVPLVSTAPEPGAWSLLLIGLAGIGAAVRNRLAVRLRTPASLHS